MIRLNLLFLFKMVIYMTFRKNFTQFFLSICRDRNIRHNFPGLWSRAIVINFQPIPGSFNFSCTVPLRYCRCNFLYLKRGVYLIHHRTLSEKQWGIYRLFYVKLFNSDNSPLWVCDINREVIFDKKNEEYFHRFGSDYGLTGSVMNFRWGGGTWNYIHYPL